MQRGCFLTRMPREPNGCRCLKFLAATRCPACVPRIVETLVSDEDAFWVASAAFFCPSRLSTAFLKSGPSLGDGICQQPSKVGCFQLR